VATLRDILNRGTNRDELAEHLDALDHAGRLGEVRALGGAELGQLFYVCAGRRAPLEQLVPHETDDDREVRHPGVSSTPFLRAVELRCWRTGRSAVPAYRRTELHGRIVAPFAGLVGPGYHTITSPERGGSTHLDFTALPASLPPDGPALRPNDSGFARRLYGDAVDELLRVSQHVTVARRRRGGRQTKTFLAFTRHDED
jgi:hypothetical protein